MNRAVGRFLLASALLSSCSGSVAGGDDPGPPPSDTPAPDPVAKPPAMPSACAAAPSVGWTPLQRLTREQYANTVRDLLAGAKVSPDALAGDETVGTFHSNLVGTATDLVAQQYMEAAENLANQVKAKLDMLVPCDRAAMGDAACADVFIDRFGLRAFRRPLVADEKTRFKAAYTTFAGNGGGHANGLRVVIQNMLQSPNFLYQVEVGAAGTAKNGVVALTPYELAARLSYLIWTSMPDDALFQAAASGALSDVKQVRAQIDRMLKDTKARDALSSFHQQWLGLANFNVVFKDDKVYPAFTPALQTAMRNETTAFVDQVIRRGDGKLQTLLTAAWTPSTDAVLLAHYGATRPAGAAATDPTPLDPAQRAGLLTQGAFLAMHAGGNESSPVQRGVSVLRNVLCVDLPDPPPNVNNNPPQPKAGATTRERFADHEKDPACGGCHKLIDGIGLGFENYDGIGAFRTMESGKPVDAHGNVLASGSVAGPFEGAVQLAKKLAASPEAQQCYARQWLRFALGRPESGADMCSLDAIYAAFAAGKQDVRELLAAIAASDAFRYRRLANDAGGAP